MLYVFEDNEAVIKMIIKGRSPTMRHVSRVVVLLLLFCFFVAELEYLKTQTLLTNLRTQKNQHQVDFCLFLEVKHLFQ